jgi:hypothetical protein
MDKAKQAMRHLLKFYRYAWRWENYLLLMRTLRAAWLVRWHLRERVLSPHFSSALPAINQLYLPPQTAWRISDATKIARFASFVVSFPVTWGRCLQQSLIIYRLLNGYGIPAQICFGISRDEANNEGHAWVMTLEDPPRLFAEMHDPRERFKLVYASPLPERAV